MKGARVLGPFACLLALKDGARGVPAVLLACSFQRVRFGNIIWGYGIDIYVSSDKCLDIVTDWRRESRHGKCENSHPDPGPSQRTQG